tara:strand:- start:605 stop:790 length:186 start_codon:yes stop_codon:yes gene_type:complete
MKTFSQFGEEARFAIENLLMEKEGFGQYAKKRRRKKKEFLSKREKKILKLKNRPSHWEGLE